MISYLYILQNNHHNIGPKLRDQEEAGPVLETHPENNPYDGLTATSHKEEHCTRRTSTARFSTRRPWTQKSCWPSSPRPSSASTGACWPPSPGSWSPPTLCKSNIRVKELVTTTVSWRKPTMSSRSPRWQKRPCLPWRPTLPVKECFGFTADLMSHRGSQVSLGAYSTTAKSFLVTPQTTPATLTRW